MFLGLTLFYFLGIFLVKNQKSFLQGKTRPKKRELTPKVSEFLFYDDTQVDASEKKAYLNLVIELKELAKDAYYRKALAEILFDLRSDVSGDAKKRLCALYKYLGLQEYSKTKLNSWRWEVVAQGIIELTWMEVSDAYGIIAEFLNDKRSVVRKQAEIALVTLNADGIRLFLDTTRYGISEWQQLKLLEVLRLAKDFDPPRFKNWLNSKNRDVVLFALRLMKHYHQNDADAALVSLIAHRNNEVKREALDCIKKFGVLKALPELVKQYWNLNGDVRLEVLDVFAVLGDESYLEFLQKVRDREHSSTLTSKAMHALNAIGNVVMPDLGEPEPETTENVETEETEVLSFEDTMHTVSSLMVTSEGREPEEKEKEVLVEEDKPQSEETQVPLALPNLLGALDIQMQSMPDEEGSYDSEALQENKAKEKEEVQDDTHLEWKAFQDTEPPEEAWFPFEDPSADLPEHYSVWSQLFDRADESSQWYLLEQMEELADAKDMEFLEHYAKDAPKGFAKQIGKVRLAILDRIPVTCEEESREEIPQKNNPEEHVNLGGLQWTSSPTAIGIDSVIQAKTIEKEQPESEITSKEKASLEYCFSLKSLDVEAEEVKGFNLFDLNFSLDGFPKPENRPS
ncbi:hypothetical protein B7P33_11775 [Sediminicola luteus]|uniref:HEAT repeat domain-containing protein n=1 Tax=Sediminicola luteus TaxID=319238 RepID=A0A2A4G5J9_9FLAO|nr:hypothetical protein B7P33_11775 [Sediminicola luteus]